MDILHTMSKEEHTATSLAECLNITLSTLSHYLKMLTKARVINMLPCLEDMRVKRLELSDHGKALLFMYENEMLFHPMVTCE